MKTIILIGAATLSGCCVMPDTITPELVHDSHAVQHFERNDRNYGSESVDVRAHWGKPTGPFLDLSEGVSLDPAWNDGRNIGHGEDLGPRERFSARIGYTFRVK